MGWDKRCCIINRVGGPNSPNSSEGDSQHTLWQHWEWTLMCICFIMATQFEGNGGEGKGDQRGERNLNIFLGPFGGGIKFPLPPLHQVLKSLARSMGKVHVNNPTERLQL